MSVLIVPLILLVIALLLLLLPLPNIHHNYLTSTALRAITDVMTSEAAAKEKPKAHSEIGL